MPRTALKHLVRLILAFAWALGSVGEAYAERCAPNGGCVGEVGYMHIPKGQRDNAKIFTKAGLPTVNDHAVLKEGGYVLSDHSLADPRLPGDLAKAGENDTQLPWGMELDSGAEVQILGYRVFPQLKELFARVLILNDGSRP
jgi:hypothetical protein